ncbi:TP53 regulated inhibitor of apoptosis 1, partial [Columba livia]
ASTTSASTAGSPRSSSRGKATGTPAGSSSSATSSACRKQLKKRIYPLKAWSSWAQVKEKLKTPLDVSCTDGVTDTSPWTNNISRHKTGCRLDKTFVTLLF